MVASSGDAAVNAALDTFVVRHWAAEPAVLRRAFAAPLCSADEMLGMIRSVCESLRRGLKIDTRFFVDGLQVPADHPLERAFMVSPSEQTLADYIDGVTERLDGRPFYLVIDNAALLQLDVWERMRGLAAQVMRHVGYPTGRIEFNAFVGTEIFTPFGIHTDRSHTLTVLVGGQSKTMLTWPPAGLAPLRSGFVTKDPERMAELSAQASSWCLDDPQDLLYVPAGWWHTSHRPAVCRFQASLAMGFALEPSPSRDVAELIARERRLALDEGLAGLGLDTLRAGHPATDGVPQTAAGLSTQVAAALERAGQLLAPGGPVMEAVEAALRLRMLRRLSGLVESTCIRNLEPVFPGCRSGGLPGAPRRVRLVRPLCRDTVRGRLTLAANGFWFATTQTAGAMAQALHLLERGEAISWDALCPGDAEVSRFLEFAWASRILVVVE